MPYAAFCRRQALETLVLDVLPSLLRLLPWRERWRLRLHVVASGTVPKPLLSLLRQHSSQVVFHGYLPDEEVSGSHLLVEGIVDAGQWARLRDVLRLLVRRALPFLALPSEVCSLRRQKGQPRTAGGGKKKAGINAFTRYHRLACTQPKNACWVLLCSCMPSTTLLWWLWRRYSLGPGSRAR